MHKMTQTEFDELERNESGYLVIPECTDCTEIDFGAADRIILGDGCKLGNCCKLGYWCKLGYCCKLGDECKLGDGCELGEYIDARATLEAGRVQDGLYVQIGNIGSEHRTAYFYIDKDGAMFVRAGCWFGEMNDFKVRVKDVHGGKIYEAQYMAACAYAEAVLPLMLKESDAAREAGETHDDDGVSSMTTMEFLRRLIRKNKANTRHAQERRDDEALTRLDETRQHLFAALRAVELAEQIGAMFGEDERP